MAKWFFGFIECNFCFRWTRSSSVPRCFPATPSSDETSRRHFDGLPKKNYDSINSPNTSPEHKITDSLLPAKDTSFLRDAFLVFRIFVAWFAIRSGDTLFLLHTPVRSEMLHFTKHEAAVLLTIYGVSATVFSIPCGILGDKSVVSETIVVSLGATLCGMSMCVSLAYNTFAEMTLNSILFGIGTGNVHILGHCL